MHRSPVDNPLEVVIVGAGVAGLEALIALRTLAGSRVQVTLVSPGRDFTYRAMSVAEPFGSSHARHYALAAIASDFGATLVDDRLEWAATSSDRIFLRGGAELSYDALVLTLGARAETPRPNGLTFRDSRDSAELQQVVAAVEAGSADSVAFVLPDGPTWPLPLYELALMTAERARHAGVSPHLALFTPESEPLGAFGPAASQHVMAQLVRAGIRLVTSVRTADIATNGEILGYDQIVNVPRLVGPALRGVPHDRDGFIPVDAYGRVAGRLHVYAAGDGTDYPIKHGAVASQQADTIAQVIAKRAGAGVDPQPLRAVLRAQLFTGGGASTFLRADQGPRATPVSEVSETPLWWPAGKVAGQYLAPYLAAQDADAFESHDRVAVAGAWIEESPYGE
jgi:sulfide:quinone oxidoreductase